MKMSQTIALTLCVGICMLFRADVSAAGDEMLQHNAYDSYCRAIDSIVVDDAVTMTSSLEEKAAVLQRNAKAMALLREGIARPYSHTRQLLHEEEPLDTPQLFMLVKLLRFEAEVRSGHGDARGAIQSLLDGIKLTADLSQSGTLAAYDAAMVHECALIHQLEHFVSTESDPATLAFLAQRYRPLRARAYTLRDAAADEKRMVVRSITALMQQPEWQEQKETDTAFGTLSDTTILSNLNHYYDYVCRVTKPNGNTGTRYAFPRLDAFSTGIVMLVDSAPATIPQRILRDKVAGCRRDLLLLAIALNTFYQVNGQFPAKLRELSPALSTDKLFDRFSPRHPYRYRRIDRDHYTLYSVGPDRVDDGGKPTADTDLSISLTSKGDLMLPTD